VGHDPAQRQAGRPGDVARQVQGRLAGQHAAAPAAGIDLDQDADAGALRGGGLAKLAGGVRAVQRDGHPHALAEIQQAAELLLTDDREGQQHVLERQRHAAGLAAVQQRLDLPDLRQGQADCACFKLHPRDLDGLVGLGVGPQRDAVLAGVVRHRADVLLQHVQVDDEHRCIELGDVHDPSVFRPHRAR
jgi:hypothetical protein